MTKEINWKKILKDTVLKKGMLIQDINIDNGETLIFAVITSIIDEWGTDGRPLVRVYGTWSDNKEDSIDAYQSMDLRMDDRSHGYMKVFPDEDIDKQVRIIKEKIAHGDD